jgi:hypothetical protein
MQVVRNRVTYNSGILYGVYLTLFAGIIKDVEQRKQRKTGIRYGLGNKEPDLAL